MILYTCTCIYNYVFPPVDSPPPKKPKIEPGTSPVKNADPGSSTPCYSSNGLNTHNKDAPPSLNSSNPPSISPPSSSSAVAQKSQIPPPPLHSNNVMQKTTSNHVASQVLNSMAGVTASGRGTVGSQQLESRYAPANMADMGQMALPGQQQQQQHNNNDVSCIYNHVSTDRSA